MLTWLLGRLGWLMIRSLSSGAASVPPHPAVHTRQPGFDSGAGNQNRRPVSCAQPLRQTPPWTPGPLPSLIPSGWLLPVAGLASKGLPLYQLTMGLGVPVTRQASLTVSPSSAVQSASSSSKSGGPGDSLGSLPSLQPLSHQARAAFASRSPHLRALLSHLPLPATASQGKSPVPP